MFWDAAPSLYSLKNYSAVCMIDRRWSGKYLLQIYLPVNISRINDDPWRLNGAALVALQRFPLARCYVSFKAIKKRLVHPSDQAGKLESHYNRLGNLEQLLSMFSGNSAFHSKMKDGLFHEILFFGVFDVI